MDCIILLLLLSCCGSFGCGGNNGSGRGSGRSSSERDGDCNNNSSRRSDNNIGRNYSTANTSFGCQDNVSVVNSDCGCGQEDNVRSISGQGPSNWQEFPEISRRDNNNSCDCEN